MILLLNFCSPRFVYSEGILYISLINILMPSRTINPPVKEWYLLSTKVTLHDTYVWLLFRVSLFVFNCGSFLVHGVLPLFQYNWYSKLLFYPQLTFLLSLPYRLVSSMKISKTNDYINYLSLKLLTISQKIR